MSRTITASDIRNAIQKVNSGPHQTTSDARRAVHIALNKLTGPRHGNISS